MLAELQKAMDYAFIGLKNNYRFLEDILNASKGSEAEHKEYVLKCLKRLDDDNLTINFPKCHFSKLEIDWLGYHISQLGISPIENKTSRILSLEAPMTLKKLLSFLVSVHYISKFIQKFSSN